MCIQRSTWHRRCSSSACRSRKFPEHGCSLIRLRPRTCCRKFAAWNLTRSFTPGHRTCPKPGRRRFFRSIAQHLKRHHQLTPVFISGPGEDVSAFQMWPTFANSPLNHVKLLMRHASLFIGNDSGPAHMAAAFGVPSVVLFGASDPVTWAPWRTTAETLVASGSMHEIGEDAVRQALDRLMVHAQ